MNYDQPFRELQESIMIESGPCEPCYWAFLYKEKEDKLWYLECPVCGTHFPNEENS